MQQANLKPRFRNDLVAQPCEEEGIRYVDVTDPSSGSTFRFYDVEYSIACAMDGARDLDSLASWTRAELGIETSSDELASVVDTLADLGYLEAAHGAAAELPGREAVRDASPAGAASPSEGDGVAPSSADTTKPLPPPAVSGTSEPGDDDDLRFELALTDSPDVAPGGPEPEQDIDEPVIEMEVAPPVVGDSAGAKPAATSGPANGAPGDTPLAGLADDDAPTRVRQGASPADLFGAHPGMAASPATVSPPAAPAPAGDAAKSEQLIDLGKAIAELAAPPAAAATALTGASPAAAPPKGAGEATPKAPAPVVPQQDKAPAGKTPAKPAPAAAETKSATGLLVFLVLLVGAAVAVYFLRDRIFGGDEFSSTLPSRRAPAAPARPAARPPAVPAVPVPQPAQPPSAKLRLEEAVVDLKVGGEGEVAWVIADGTAVAAGEPVVKLAGFQPAERARDKLKKELAGLGERLAFYETKNNVAKVAEKKAAMTKVQEKLAEAEAALGGFVVGAPSAGKAQPLVGLKAKVKAGDPVVRLAGEPQLVAELEMGADAPARVAGGACTLAVKAAPDRQLTCVIDAVAGGKIRLHVVASPGVTAAADEEIVLLPPPKTAV